MILIESIHYIKRCKERAVNNNLIRKLLKNYKTIEDTMIVIPSRIFKDLGSKLKKSKNTNTILFIKNGIIVTAYKTTDNLYYFIKSKMKGNRIDLILSVP